MKSILGVVAALMMVAAGPAVAQTNYPEQTVRILHGFTAGTAPDVFGRLLADKLSEMWGKPVVIETITGAGGNIAADRVAKAAPDGYTLLLGGNSSIIFAPSLYDRLPFDPVKDFAPVAHVFVAANILVVPVNSPIKSVDDLVARARAEPGKLTYAHTGAGSSQHLAGELFKAMAKLNIQPVAYRGSTALLPDLLAGRVDMGFTNIVHALPLVREGKLRGFAVTSRKRTALAPELPTMAESGFPGFEAVPWFGLYAPTGTPQAIIDKLNRDTLRVLGMPDVRAKLGQVGIDVTGGTPAELAAVIKAEIPQWAKVIKDAGIKAGD
jgi:tripartite-type tricarboxylate transporter receptor subunit TctC